MAGLDDLSIREQTWQYLQESRWVSRHPEVWRQAVDVTAGLASIHLELRSSNEAARAFYRAMGFPETLLVPGYYRGKESATRMVRVLRVPGPLPFNWRPPTLNKK